MSFTSATVRPPVVRTTVWRDVYIAATAKGVTICGDFLAATTLVLTLQSAGAGGVAVAALLLASTLPLVLLAPVAGRLADRVDSRTLLITAGAGQAAVCVALALVSEPMVVIGLVFLLSCGLAVSQPVLSALIPAMVGREDLPRAGAISQTAGTVGALVGPALAGLLVGQFGTTVPLLIDAASYGALVAAGLLLRTRRGGRAATPTDPAASPAVGGAATWSLWRDPLLRAMVVSVAAVIGVVGAINVVAVFFVRETLAASETMYGVVEAAWMVGLLAGAWLCARLARRTRDDAALVVGILVLLGATCLILPVAAVVGTVIWLIPLWVIGGAFNGGENVFAGVVMGNRVPEAVLGRAFATLGGVIQGASMAGYLAGGLLADRVPIRPLVAGLGLVGLAVVLGLAVPVARITRRERKRVAVAAPADGTGAGLATSSVTG
ncbi:MFS transporter [Micromonospora sp. NBC_01796]|uniref:MFS transporter n=1 Tax=Micromonospora sp. NBC_01796 TaxID=2975987 RepID=UPI002DDB37AB|nr:MFS transporter [Micromonospora sp. NBC_01796]WSA88163.1 MFS transporter [Micromonospora sp. NBC_01796]